ncbi:MAG: hypothetical protein ACI4NA_01210 [Succinivibrio sp.]
MKSPLNALFLAAACLAALWIMAMHGYAAIPLGTARALALGAASAVMLASGAFKARGRHYVQAMLVWSLALACWAFYAERHFLLPQGDPRLIHAVAVYNLFRYFLLLCCLVIFIRDTIRALRELS